jgi:hypothetical protein
MPPKKQQPQGHPGPRPDHGPVTRRAPQGLAKGHADHGPQGQGHTPAQKRSVPSRSDTA